MAGIHVIFLFNVLVADISQWSMLLVAAIMAFLLFTNELCDITAELLSQVCHNVGTVLSLQPITDQLLIHQTANREEGAWLNLTAKNFGVMIDNVRVLR